MTQYNLTPKQTECLIAIMNYIDENEVSPNYDEIAAAMGLRSKSAVFRLVSALEERGHIIRIPSRARSITVVEATNRGNNWHSSLLLEEAFSQPHVRAAMTDGLRARVTKHLRDIKLGVA